MNRSTAFEYIATDIPAGITIGEYRRSCTPAAPRRHLLARLIRRFR